MRTGAVPNAWAAHVAAFEEIRKLNGTASTAEQGSADAAWPLVELTDGLTKASILDCVLGAAMRQAGSTATKVRFAVEWHDAERLKLQISMIPAWDAARVTILRDALQLSLELQHERCVAACIAFAAPVKQIDLLSIYDQLYDEKDPPMIYLFKGEPKPTERLRKHAVGEVEKGMSVDLDDPIYAFYPVEVWSLLQQQVRVVRTKSLPGTHARRPCSCTTTCAQRTNRHSLRALSSSPPFRFLIYARIGVRR